MFLSKICDAVFLLTPRVIYEFNIKCKRAVVLLNGYFLLWKMNKKFV